VKDQVTNNFGLVIAYLLPGAVALWGAAYLSPLVQAWFGTSPGTAPTIGGFLYVTLGSIGAGLIVSAVRWAVLDTLYHRTGIPQPRWDFSKLPGRVEAFEGLVENHYRYYQFYGNLLVALVFLYGARLARLGWGPQEGGVWPQVGFVTLAAILLLASRDTLRKYYSRAAMILRAERRRR
jgi:hypothetical protein